MTTALWLIAGCVIGSLLAWVAATAKARVAAAAQLTEAEGRIRAAEAVRDELGRRLATCESELADTRRSEQTEREGRTRAETQLEGKDELSHRLAAAEQDLDETRKSMDGERQARVKAETQLDGKEDLSRRLGEAEQALDEARRRAEEEGQARARAVTQLEAAELGLKDQRRLIEAAAAELSDKFRSLSAQALESSNQSFLVLARESLGAIVNQASGDVRQRQEAIDGLIRPLQEALRRYEEQVNAMEVRRQEAYGGLQEQLKSLTATQQQLQRSTGNLVTALRTPAVRGRWGEVTLRRVVELAGLSEHCDFDEQPVVETYSGRQRPDMTVHLPADRDIVVDAKVSLDAYLDATEAAGEAERETALARHAQQIRAHMQRLAEKAYWEQFPRAPEIVVMFIPGESFFAAAVDCDRTLIEDGMARRVILATPTTLIALLHSVAYGWRQEQVAKNAEEISRNGKRLYDSFRVLAEHVVDVGAAIGKAVGSYNKAVGSIEARVLPAARRFKDLGAATGAEIPTVEALEQAPREMGLLAAGTEPE